MNPTTARIMVVEDEPDLAQGISENLVEEGYAVEHITDGAQALQCLLRDDYDLVILDVMLPGIDGFTVCRRLREQGRQIPVLFLTAKGAPGDRIRGLEEGGDDYLGKPFQLRELLLRVAAILRRSLWYGNMTETSALVRFGDSEVDFGSYRGRGWDGSVQVLTHKEAMILRLLFEREGEVVSRDEILDTVWGYEVFPSSRTIDNFILRLRRRFELDSQNPRHFHTIRGVGYRFTSAPTESR